MAGKITVKNTSDSWKSIGKYNIRAGEKVEVWLSSRARTKLRRMRSLKVIEDSAAEQEEQTEEEKTAAEPEEVDTEPEIEEVGNEYPRALGGGWYELSDGSRARGQEVAEEEQQKLDGGGSD